MALPLGLVLRLRVADLPCPGLAIQDPVPVIRRGEERIAARVVVRPHPDVHDLQPGDPGDPPGLTRPEDVHTHQPLPAGPGRAGAPSMCRPRAGMPRISSARYICGSGSPSGVM